MQRMVSDFKMFGVVVLIKWHKLRPVLVRYLPFKFEYNRTHISVHRLKLTYLRQYDILLYSSVIASPS